jgi:hypothetical protein
LVATRTSLFTFLGAKAATNKTLAYDLDEGWISSRKQVQIAPEEYVGSEFKEVGIGYSATAANLVTHALLKDMNGNTITIVKTDTDVINIYATVFVHWDTAGYGGAKVWANTLNDFLTGYLAGDWTSNLEVSPVKLLVTPGGTPYASEDGYRYMRYTIAPVYNAATKTISISKRLGISDSNMPIRRLCVVTGGDNCPGIAIDCAVGGTWFSGTTINGEALGTGDGLETAFRTAHGWIKPGATVYVDGVEQTGVSVTTGLPNVKTNFGAMFEHISASGEHALLGYLHPEMMSTEYFSTESEVIYFNPFSAHGIKDVYCQGQIYMSEDVINWVSVVVGSGAVYTIPAEHRTKPYIKYTGYNPYENPGQVRDWTADTLPEYDINFASPPANGAVITIDYETESIAKDVNHVFDFSLTITLGEKTD